MPRLAVPAGERQIIGRGVHLSQIGGAIAGDDPGRGVEGRHRSAAGARRAQAERPAEQRRRFAAAGRAQRQFIGHVVAERHRRRAVDGPEGQENVDIAGRGGYPTGAQRLIGGRGAQVGVEGVVGGDARLREQRREQPRRVGVQIAVVVGPGLAGARRHQPPEADSPRRAGLVRAPVVAAEVE